MGVWLERGTPWFFVSVASTGLSLGVSLLDATLAGCLVNVAGKELTEPDPVGISAPEMHLSFDLNVQASTRLNVNSAERTGGPAFPTRSESAIAEAMAGDGGYPPHQNA